MNIASFSIQAFPACIAYGSSLAGSEDAFCIVDPLSSEDAAVVVNNNKAGTVYSIP